MISVFFDNWPIIVGFFCIAVCYASVGFGGGSSYLAVLSLTGIVFTDIRITALVCNIVVVSGNVLAYHKAHQIEWKKISPLIACSIPFAFIGGVLKITEQFFFIILSITLIFAGFSTWRSTLKHKTIIKPKQQSYTKNAVYGSSIGFLSGLVGIGGGIFLAPLLHYINWNTPKKIAATASVFILLNSVAGLFGYFSNLKAPINIDLLSILIIAVFIGGFIGRRFSNTYFTQLQIKRATAVLIIFVGFRILINFYK